jgi:ArsR family transcriptional regulator
LFSIICGDQAIITKEEKTTDADSILDILGNETRRKILFVLSQEPMYFNQLSKEIGIGQQAILRHMQALENRGLIKTYAEKSDLGAPDRKYYRLSSSFSLTIALSQDSFSIENHKMIVISGSRGKHTKFYEKLESIRSPRDKNKTGKVLTCLKKELGDIEKEISDLQTRLSELRSLKQLILSRIHEIGKDNFEPLERKVLNTIIATITIPYPSSISKIASMLNENESNIRNAIVGICDKLDDESAAALLGELR